jgi:tetratricopeptide (TPR) repeat protein
LALSFAIVLCVAPVALADSGQNTTRAREQSILKIQQLIENHDFLQASRLLGEAAKTFPGDAGLENLRGVIAAQQGDYKEAENSFHQAIKHSPKFTAAYLNLGRLYQENSAEDPQARRKALEVYKRVLEYEATNTEAHYQSAVLLLQTGAYQKSLDHVERLPADVRSSAQTLSIVCADYAALGNGKGADSVATELAVNPDLSEVDVQQALPGLIAGKREDLIISLLEALQKHHAPSPEMMRTFGLAYEHTGKLAEARAALEKSATRETLSVRLLMELARVAHKQKDYQGALGYLAHARDLEPNNAKLHYYFGLVCVDLNLVAEARNSFEKAVQLDPENAAYNYAMGATSAFRHDPAEAVPYFEKYLKLKPGDARAKLALGDAFYRAKDYETAAPWLREAAKAPETAASAHYYLGSIALQERRLDEAFNELGQALKAKPEYADARAELGQYYLTRKDYTNAEKQIRSALSIEPGHFSANFYLLTLYTRTGDSRREEQAKRWEELQRLRDEKTQEYLRIVEVRPYDTP